MLCIVVCRLLSCVDVCVYEMIVHGFDVRSADVLLQRRLLFQFSSLSHPSTSHSHFSMQ